MLKRALPPSHPGTVLRELFMKQFNQFWLSHVPNLLPTAGYPNDAPRFYRAIEPACQKLGIAKEAVWRSR